MKLKPLFVWEKYRCPFGVSEGNEEWPDYVREPAEKNIVYNDGYREEEECSFPFEMQEKDVIRPRDGTHFLATSVGFLNLSEFTSPATAYNLWFLYVNFPITDGVGKLLNETDGVEVLSVLSKYRAIVGTGKVFPPREVMHNVEKRIKKHLRDTKKPKFRIRLQD